MKTFAVLQLVGLYGCEVSLLNADEWVGEYRLAHMPLVISDHLRTGSRPTSGERRGPQ